MAFFDENELSSVGSVCIEAAEGYSGAIGAQLALIEGYQNDLTMFTQAIRTDIKEAKMVRESAGEEEIGAMQEGALNTFWEKIKEFIRKIIAKVKSVFHGFLAKFEAWMGKNGYAFFEKYKREIYSGKDISKLKINYSKPKVASVDAIKVDISKISTIVGKDQKNSADADGEALISEMLGQMMHPTLSSVDKGSFRKDYHEACFEDAESGHECSNSEIDTYMMFIASKKPIDDIKKMATDQEKMLNGIIRQVESFDKSRIDKTLDKTKDAKYQQVSQTFGGGTSGQNRTEMHAKGNELEQKESASYAKRISAMNTALGMGNSAALTEIKFGVAQSRRIAAAIVAYNPKKHEDVDLVMMEAEAAEYDALSELEAVC